MSLPILERFKSCGASHACCLKRFCTEEQGRLTPSRKERSDNDLVHASSLSDVGSDRVSAFLVVTAHTDLSSEHVTLLQLVCRSVETSET